MEKKIWQIPDTLIDKGSKKDIGDSFTKKETHPYIKTDEKNPALAATLSMFLCGGGQIYNGNIRAGLLLLGTMIASGIAFYLLLINWSAVFTYLNNIGFTQMNIVFMIFFLYALLILLWFGNIINAYLTAERTRKNPYNGAENPFLSGMASTLIAGWGQFINGQPKKAAIYLFVFLSGIFGITFIVSVSDIWQSINLEYEKSTLETMIAAAAILTFTASVLWLINIFDAIIVAFEPVKKEPVRNRLKYSINRIKSRRHQMEMWQRLKVTFFLMLLLILSVAISYSIFPREYYYNTLTSISRDLNKNGMKVLPAYIQDIADTIFHKKQKESKSEKNSI